MLQNRRECPSLSDSTLRRYWDRIAATIHKELDKLELGDITPRLEHARGDALQSQRHDHRFWQAPAAWHGPCQLRRLQADTIPKFRIGLILH